MQQPPDFASVMVLNRLHTLGFIN